MDSLIVIPCGKTPQCVLEKDHQPPCKVPGGKAVGMRGAPPALFITLNGERGRDWQAAVGTRTFPVTSKKPEPASVLGNVVMAYFLDLTRVTPQLRDRIEHFLSERFQSPLDQVRDEIVRHGLPIMAKNITTPEGFVLGDAD